MSDHKIPNEEGDERSLSPNNALDKIIKLNKKNTNF